MVNLLTAARVSLSGLWVFTGLTSLLLAPELGYEILDGVGIKNETAKLLVYSGSVIDIGLGLWILTSWKIKICCVIQIIIITLYTLLLTILDASFWLHPFGPLTKNIPIIVLIFIVMTNVESVCE